MKAPILWRAATVVTIALAVNGHNLTQTQNALGGLIHHYADAPATNPWHISGEWSIWLKGRSGMAEFSAALAMVRSDDPARMAHTHHLILTDGVVTALPNGFQVSGVGTVTGNGAAPFTDEIVVNVTGGSTVQYSNITVAFAGPGITHFGSQPLQGVVTSRD